MEFTFGDEVKDGPLALGMHKKGSFYDIVTVDGCRLVDDDYSAILRETLYYFEEKKTPFYHRYTHEGIFCGICWCAGRPEREKFLQRL